jgi:hypothetical protein
MSRQLAGRGVHDQASTVGFEKDATPLHVAVNGQYVHSANLSRWPG